VPGAAGSAVAPARRALAGPTQRLYDVRTVTWGEASDAAGRVREALAGAVQRARDRVDEAGRDAAARVEAGLRESEQARARRRAELVEARAALARRIDGIERSLRRLSSELNERAAALGGGGR